MPSINLDPITLEEGYPPVDRWHPDFCGDMDLLIKANGEWIHEGSAIKREKMVTLFSRILWREGNEYFLVTPAEKVRIQVEDVPFQIVRAEQIPNSAGEFVWRFYTKTNDVLTLGEDCRIELRPYQGDWMPYVSVRHGMWANFHRNVYYQLIEEAEQIEQAQGITLQLKSAGQPHTIGTFHEI